MNNSIQIGSGDIILFSRPCLSMQPFAAFLCFGAKMSALSQWDHIGIVVEDPSNGILFLLEANMGGVTLRRLSDRIARTKAHAIGVRKLVKLDGNVSDTELNRMLWELARNRVNKSYNSSTVEMTRGILHSYTSHSSISMRARYLKNILNSSMAILRSEIGSNAPTQSFFTRALLIHRLKQLEEETIQCSNTSPLQFPGEDPAASKYFCSSLVAEILVKSSVLSDVRPSNSFLPPDFSSSCQLETMPMMGDKFAYSPDLVLVPVSDKGSMGKSDGFIAAPVANTVGQMMISRAQKDTSSRRKGRSKPAYTFHFRTGDTLPPSETKEMLSSYGPDARVFVQGHIDVLTAVKTDSGEQSLRLLGSLREGHDGGGGSSSSGSSNSDEKKLEQGRSICSTLSIEELAEFQRCNPQAEMFLRAGLFGRATLHVESFIAPDSPPSSAASTRASPRDPFAIYQLPVSLWKEILLTFRQSHSSSLQDYHLHSHGSDESAGILPFRTKSGAKWGLNTDKNFVASEVFAKTLETVGLNSRQRKCILLLSKLLDENGLQCSRTGQVNVAKLCICDSIVVRIAAAVVKGGLMFDSALEALLTSVREVVPMEDNNNIRMVLGGILRQYIYQVEISSGENAESNSATQMGLASTILITSAWPYRQGDPMQSNRSSRWNPPPPAAAAAVLPQWLRLRNYGNFRNLIQPRIPLMQCYQRKALRFLQKIFHK